MKSVSNLPLGMLMIFSSLIFDDVILAFGCSIVSWSVLAGSP